MGELLTQIPVPILEELNERFDNVSIDLGSEITETTQSYKLKHVEVSEELITLPVLDPKTFETNDVTGFSAKCFLARLDIHKGNCIVRRVLAKDDIVVQPKDE